VNVHSDTGSSGCRAYFQPRSVLFKEFQTDRLILKLLVRVKKLSGGVLAWLCLERGAYLHMAQLMPLPLTVSCVSEIQVGFTFLVPAHPGSPGQRAIKRVCVNGCVWFVCVIWPVWVSGL